MTSDGPPPGPDLCLGIDVQAEIDQRMFEQTPVYII